jgi:hypothetical protein
MALISVSAAALRAQGFFLLLLVCGTSWAMERPKAQNTDFAFAFQCQDGKSCLIGEFPKNLQITLLSPKGVVCHAKTLDVYEHEGPVGPIPVTRLDTSGCRQLCPGMAGPGKRGAAVPPSASAGGPPAAGGNSKARPALPILPLQ